MNSEALVTSMNSEGLHVLFQQVVESNKNYGKAMELFGENSMQAQKARDLYNERFAAWRREHYWETFCSTEGPWQPECRSYDC
ncbi:MAG: hypothetical protein CMK37_07790 [Porticoccaceae bacterium]|nr:hypothetical protein [Porticoccaceae bacterium]|tara:strand:- start:66 stop:314 length:249 start_codon:yes stop_codon:yes gene_type:complete